MCAPLWTLWAGRKHNGPILERPRGGNVNTRVVKLVPLKSARVKKERGWGGEEGVELEERGVRG